MLIRYLHISDLHLTRQAKGKAGVEKSDQDMVTESMLKKIKKLTQEEKKTFDLIFITGDLAYGGKPDDYEVVEVFCERLLEATGVPRERLFLVPGNHDIDRSQVKPSHKDRLYNFDKEEQITEVLGDEDLFPLVMRKFDAFNHFAEQAMGRTLYSQTKYYFTLPVSIPTGEEKVLLNVVGLNSALFAGYDGDDKQKLAFGLPQVDAALSDLKKNARLTIVLFHHPFDCSHPEDKKWCSKRILKDADLILTGHLHEPENMWIHNGVAEAVLISAGASFEKRESEDNSFNVGEIDLTTGSGEVQFYKYLHDHNLWKDNTDANPGDPRGIFHFQIDRLKPKEDNHLPKIGPGTDLAKLILERTRDIEECIQKVESITNYKQIHDCLHELLQNVILPLREEVLPEWAEEGELSMRMEKKIGQRASKASEQRGKMSEVREPIGPQHKDLRASVDKVLNQAERWVADWYSADPPPSSKDFAEVVNKFADYVEDAFSEADRSMTTEETELHERYSRLRERLKQEGIQRNLSAGDHKRLDDELEKVHANRENVTNALMTHRRWQEVHNKLREVDSFRQMEAKTFENKLNYYRETWLPKMFDLVDEQLQQAHGYQTGIAEPEKEAVTPVVRQALAPLSPCAPDASGAFLDYMARLKAALEKLRQGDGAVAFDEMGELFDEMRKRFDEAFYYVDKRTLKEVSSAKGRVVALKEWLHGLDTGRRKSD